MQAVRLNIFDILEPLSWVEENLLRGSGYEHGKIRIYAAAMQLDQKKLAEFLKEEYGVGGCSIKEGFMDYNAKGISLRKWKENTEEKHNWNEAAKSVKRLIGIDRYLTENEKTEIKKLQKKHKGTLPLPNARMQYA